MNELSKKPTQPPKIRPKYQAYADSILKGNTQRQAGLDAGCSSIRADSQSYRMGQNDQVQAYIAYHRAILAERNKITIDEIVANTREIIERCMQHAPVLDRKGNQVYVETADGVLTPAYTFQPASAIKGNELLARLGGLLNDVSPDTGHTFIGIQFKNYPHAQPEQGAIDAHTTNQQQLKP